MRMFFMRKWAALFLIILFSGCGIHARIYSQDRQRVDQERPSGKEPLRKTRKVYVLEVTKDPKASAPKAEVQSKPEERAAGMKTAEETPKTNLAPVVPPAPPQPAAALPMDYKVEKDDTLQSISKKFYGAYSKWPKIYDANKDKIPDPNRIKAGIVLTIPKE